MNPESRGVEDTEKNGEVTREILKNKPAGYVMRPMT